MRVNGVLDDAVAVCRLDNLDELRRLLAACREGAPQCHVEHPVDGAAELRRALRGQVQCVEVALGRLELLFRVADGDDVDVLAERHQRIDELEERLIEALPAVVLRVLTKPLLAGRLSDVLLVPVRELCHGIEHDGGDFKLPGRGGIGELQRDVTSLIDGCQFIDVVIGWETAERVKRWDGIAITDEPLRTLDGATRRRLATLGRPVDRHETRLRARRTRSAWNGSARGIVD